MSYRGNSMQKDPERVKILQRGNKFDVQRQVEWSEEKAGHKGELQPDHHKNF